jgi:Carboxypeptidase regulatory-like domain
MPGHQASGEADNKNAGTAAALLMASWTIILIASIILIGGAPAFCAELVGTVFNNRGEPVPGVTVSLVNSAGADAGRGVSDAHGRYAISNLTSGTYKLGSSGQWVMAYIGDRGLTVNWGLAPHSPPVAVATLGTAGASPLTTSAKPAKISHVRAKPHKTVSDDDSDDDQN